ncbi:probable RNA-binding protein EIF1AD [Coccinella septempunctata]|uniref:probable RNA-binding protein EIF1AD n=1 Tax=Coccinella septempunctata TaxID=41139 RepID=UPI001D08E439|nr:probable RNA-binding protein EIF1AD [Coccinella septempunctata]
MSRALKRKHIMREVYDYSPPTENQQIVKITESKGNNLHEIETPDKTRFLVSMPVRYRNYMWVKRGSFVIIQPIEEGVKVKGEIVRVLTSEHIKYFKEDKIWPAAFYDKRELEESDNDDGSDDDIPVNPNRIQAMIEESSDSDSSDNDSSDNDKSDNDQNEDDKSEGET